MVINLALAVQGGLAIVVQSRFGAVILEFSGNDAYTVHCTIVFKVLLLAGRERKEGCGCNCEYDNLFHRFHFLLFVQFLPFLSVVLFRTVRSTLTENPLHCDHNHLHARGNVAIALPQFIVFDVLFHYPIIYLDTCFILQS